MVSFLKGSIRKVEKVVALRKLAVKQNGVHQYTKMAQKDRNAHAAVKSSFVQNECTVATMISLGGCAV